MTTSYEEYSLEQLGKAAYESYKRGEVANKRAGDLANTSGQFLAEAKRRIDTDHPYGKRTQAFEKFLVDHCPLPRGISRAYQLIAIATGKTTEVEEQEKNSTANREYRQRKKASCPSRDGKPPQRLSPPNTERADLMATITVKLRALESALAKLSIEQLHALERIIPTAAHLDPNGTAMAA
ncbi:hypothetical protein NKJ26_27765 [Mesorhizobium sp. M0152]|uniref:hypothetical protein n=1 Tax=Mesorhizobium sp. M0152 TaxID=2956898 RepID=UPI0033369039